MASEDDLDREFVLESVRRQPLLESLRAEPRTASELVDVLDHSRSTIHRAISSLEENRIITRENGTYELTTFGETLTAETRDFMTRVETAWELEPFLNTVDRTDVPIERFAAAEFTKPQPRLPHASIQRIMELIETSSELRLLSTVISPVYVNVAYHEMLDGMEIAGVFEPETIEIMITQYEQKAQETVSTGNFEVFVHDDIPFELFLFDDRMGMAAHDENGIAQVFVECEADTAIEWAEQMFEQHRESASPLMTDDLVA